MTREQQRQFKQLNTALPKILKELAKEKKLKKKDYMLYATRKDMFFDCIIFVSVNDNNECICSTRETMKPFWIDDLLWELLDMKENAKAPVSLRAVGAFTISGVDIYQKQTVLNEWTEDELRKVVEEFVDHFCKSIKETPESAFEDNLNQEYHRELRQALYYIHNEQYQKALDCIGETGEGLFRNGDISINDAIRDYCRGKKYGFRYRRKRI